jgi:hypothetical protein
MRVWNLPLPPNRLSITPNNSVGSHTIRPLPRSGRTAMMLKLVGTTSSRRNMLYFCTCTVPTEISGLRRMKLNSPTRRLRAKRSLMTSIVGMRPRTIRSWLERS